MKTFKDFITESKSGKPTSKPSFYSPQMAEKMGKRYVDEQNAKGAKLKYVGIIDVEPGPLGKLYKFEYQQL
jgi:hypothetical protein